MVCQAGDAVDPAPASFAYRAIRGHRFERLALADAETQAIPRDGLLWVHIDGNDGECVAWLDTQAHLPGPVIEALRAKETRPRAAPIGTAAIVNLRGLNAAHDPEADELVSIRLWAEKGRVLTLSYYPLAALADVRGCFEAGKIADPGDFIAGLAETITEGLDPVVADLGDRLDDLETAFAKGDTGIRDPLGDVRRLAVNYRRFLLPQRDAIVRLASADFAWLADDDRLHIREAADRAQRMAEELDAVRDRAGVLAAQMTDRRSDEANQRMLVLSIVAAVFLPLTFLTGLFGMNVGGLPFKQSWGFWAVVALCLTIASGMALWFRHRRWI